MLSYPESWLAKTRSSGYRPIVRAGFLLNCSYVIEVVDASAATGETITVNINGSPITGTEGVDWSAASGDEATTAGEIESWIHSQFPGLVGGNVAVRTRREGAVLWIVPSRRATSLAITFSSAYAIVRPGSRVTQSAYHIANVEGVPGAEPLLVGFEDSGTKLDPVERTTSAGKVEITTEGDPWLRRIIELYGVRNMLCTVSLGFQKLGDHYGVVDWQTVGTYYLKTGKSLGREEAGQLQFSGRDVFGFLKDKKVYPPAFVGGHPLQVIVKVLDLAGFAANSDSRVDWSSFDPTADDGQGHFNLSNLPDEDGRLSEELSALDIINHMCLLTGGGIRINGAGQLEYSTNPINRATAVATIDSNESIDFIPEDDEDLTINSISWNYGDRPARAGVREIEEDSRRGVFSTQRQDFLTDDFPLSIDSAWLTQTTYGKREIGEDDDFDASVRPAIFRSDRVLWDDGVTYANNEFTIEGAAMLGFAGLRIAGPATIADAPEIDAETGAELDNTANPPRFCVLKFTGPGRITGTGTVDPTPTDSADEYLVVDQWGLIDTSFSYASSNDPGSVFYTQIDDFSAPFTPRIVPNRVRAFIDSNYNDNGYTDGREGRGTVKPSGGWLLEEYSQGADRRPAMVSDVTIPSIRSDQILDRFQFGGPKVESTERLDQISLQISDVVSFVDPEFVAEGIDGLDDTILFEVTSRRLQLMNREPNIEFGFTFLRRTLPNLSFSLPQSPSLPGSVPPPRSPAVQRTFRFEGILNESNTMDNYALIDYSAFPDHNVAMDVDCRVFFEGDGAVQQFNRYQHAYGYIVDSAGTSIGSRSETQILHQEALTAMDFDVVDDGVSALAIQIDDDGRQGTYLITGIISFSPP